jgi:hypothetical protein
MEEQVMKRDHDEKNEVMVVRMTHNIILFHIYIVVVGLLLFVRQYIEFEINSTTILRISAVLQKEEINQKE